MVLSFYLHLFTVVGLKTNDAEPSKYMDPIQLALLHVRNVCMLSCDPYNFDSPSTKSWFLQTPKE